MEHEQQEILLRLIRSSRVAALGTLRGGAPEVSMVPFAAAKDCTAFFLHISRLAHHTQNIRQDSRVSLMIAEPDDGTRNPQAFARVAIQGEALAIEHATTVYENTRAAYLAKLPEAAMTFELGDFSLYSIVPKSARFVAGFAQAYNLVFDDFRNLTSSA